MTTTADQGLPASVEVGAQSHTSRVGKLQVIGSIPAGNLCPLGQCGVESAIIASVRVLRPLRRRAAATWSRGLRVRAVEPEDVSALVEQDPDGARRGPILEWLDLPGAWIIGAYVIEVHGPTSGRNAVRCWLLIITTFGAPCHALFEVRKSEFRKLRRCRSEDLHLIALNLAAHSASLNDPNEARRGVVRPAGLGRPGYSRSGRGGTPYLG